MPDVLGPLYEAVLTHCLLTRGEDVEVSAPRPQPTCRKTCPHTSDCSLLPWNPSLDVDPDVLGRTTANKPLVGFVTHWRTTGFEKKFWRTVEEILEHQTHRPGGVGVSFVAEPISQSDRLRLALRSLAGVDVDMTTVWDRKLQKSVEELEVAVDEGSIPSEASAALAFVETNVTSMIPLARYVQAVSGVLAASQLQPSCRIAAEHLHRMCFESRKRSPSWKVRPIACSARTPAQLLALVLYALDADGLQLTDSDFARAQLSLPRNVECRALRALAATPFRIAGRERHGFIAVVDTIRGPVLRLEERAFPEGGRTPGALVLARTYLEYLKNSGTWAGYLERLTRGMLGPQRCPSTLTLSREDARESVVDAVERARQGWRLDLLISAAELSQVRLAAAADADFERLTGATLKAISAFGDEAKKVVSYCTRNCSGDLRSAPGLSLAKTLSALSASLWKPLDAAIDWPLNMESALSALCVRDMRTFLSGAPHPVLGALSVTLRSRGLRYEPDRQVPTIVNAWYGGNTGRTEYQFEIHCGSRPLFVKVSTGQDGNEGHKWKELAGRVRAHRALAGDVEVWLVLDGEWSEDAVRKLHEAGYSKIFAVDELVDFENELVAWIQG